jgi:GTP pyrophosphokinase
MTRSYRSTLANWLQKESPNFTQATDYETIITQGSDLLATFPQDSNNLIERGIEIANELLLTTTDPTLVISCLLLPHFQALAEDNWPEELDQYPCLNDLARGVARMGIQNKVQDQKREERMGQSAALRKMLLAMVDDIRVVIIKLCEQTAEVRKLHKNPDNSKRWQAEMGLHVYASLANRLGLGQLKWVLEDLSFRYLEPDAYKEISKMLHRNRTEREAYIVSFKKILEELLKTKTNCSQFNISGRAKHIYSIYRKCKQKNCNNEAINDATALRILLPTVADCYAVLSAIHATWNTVPDEFDDYISNPKPNGYRSLHTVIKGPEDTLVEIQLRTFDMHEEAELGVAAHWKYKEIRSSSEQNTSKKINWLQSLLSWHEEIDTDRDKSLYREAFQNRIYVFTPNNKIIDLPLKSTPLDFAYCVHTDIGHSCIGAKVNGRIVPLTYQLITGDQIKILTQKNSTPSRDWLNKKSGYLASKHAQVKVRNYFRKEFYDDYLKLGQEIWEKHLGQEKINKTDLQKLISAFKMTKLDDLFCALGSNDMHIRTLINKLRIITGIESNLLPVKKTTGELAKHKKDSTIVIEGVSNLLTQLARCCHPVPGDEVKGYITQSSGVSIHCIDCDNIQHAIKQKPERIINATWGEKKSARFPVNIEIVASNDSQTDKKIVSYIVTQEINVLRHSSQSNHAQSARIYRYNLDVLDKDQLNQLITGLRNIAGIRDVRRA